MATPSFPITGDEDADRLLVRDPLALLLGMLLDQQVPMEWAFRGPARLRERLGGRLDAAEIAAMDPDALEEVFREKPALHRFPAAMARRTRALCEHLVAEHGGDAGAIWGDGAPADDVLRRLLALPGFGEEKARIMLAVLAKRLGVRPRGWEDAAAPFSDATPRSAADVGSPEALEEVRAFKRARKAAGKGKAD